MITCMHSLNQYSFLLQLYLINYWWYLYNFSCPFTYQMTSVYYWFLNLLTRKGMLSWKYYRITNEITSVYTFLNSKDLRICGNAIYKETSMNIKYESVMFANYHIFKSSFIRVGIVHGDVTLLSPINIRFHMR